MEIDALLLLLRGWAFVLITFGVSLGIVMFRGRQNLINLMLGVYLGLLLYQLFPYKGQITNSFDNAQMEASALLAIFVVFAGFGTWLFTHLMPSEFFENTFETMGKKLLLAVATTILVMGLSHYYLPVSEIANLGTPLPPVILSENFAFLWLTAPLVVLFFN